MSIFDAPRPTMRELVNAQAIGLVVDRDTIAKGRELVSALGGEWLNVFKLWERLDDFPALVLVANSRKRIRLRAPLAIMAKDGELAGAMSIACQQLSDVKCCWLVLPEGEARELVGRELLSDTRAEGVA